MMLSRLFDLSWLASVHNSTVASIYTPQIILFRSLRADIGDIKWRHLSATDQVIVLDILFINAEAIMPTGTVN